MSILSIKNISKFYALDGKNREQALRNINLQIAEGKITAIYGPSGCGKTSLLNIISGLDREYEGVLDFKGESLRELSEIELTQFRKDNIGFVFQNFNLIPHQSVLDNVKLPLYVKDLSDKEMTRIAQEQLLSLGMEPFMAKNVKQLSGGQKQRVAIAGVTALEPSVIILDEATSMLDPKGRMEVIGTIQKLHKEKNITVISITHDLDEAAQADRIVLMEQGQIQQIGTPEEIFKLGTKLVEKGLDVPFAEKLIEVLREKGMEVPEAYLDEEGLVEWLWTSILTK